MITLVELEKEIDEIKSRNKSVGADKAWETSWARRILIAVFTYLAIGLYMRAIDLPRPWLNSIVPAIGFLLSTLTMPFFKKIWIRAFYKSKER